MAAKKTSAKRARTSAIDTQGQLLNMLHQVWLAGLGAVSRAQHGAPKLLEELIAEGAHVQADTQQAAAKALRGALSGVQETLNARMGKVRGDAADAFENLEKIFRARVHGALTQLGVPSAGEVQSLSKRVDALNANIDKLARSRKAMPRMRATRKNGPSHLRAH
ncbi:MAG TPA: phasin family protein [Steroidobacteraceae bacterium]|nr:phasin family protein [Steroidobacteraceae bacterium]